MKISIADYTVDTETKGSDGDRKGSDKSGLESNESDNELVNDKDDYFDAGKNENQKQEEVHNTS